jgi:hypothetical protein
MIRYLKGEIDLLEALIDEHCVHLAQWTREGCPLEITLRLRLETRKCKIQETTLDACLSFIEGSGPWKGELLFIVANAYGIMGMHSKAAICYLRSSRILEEGGSFKNAIRALLNHVASETESKIF